MPGNLHTEIVDEVIEINDETVGEVGPPAAKEEGIFVGISSGAHIAAAAQVAPRPGEQGQDDRRHHPVFGERYLSTVLFEGLVDAAVRLDLQRHQGAGE